MIDVDELLERTQRVASEVIAPKAGETDAKGDWPEAGIRAILEAGMGGLVVPSECGGLDQGLATLVHVCEIVGSACASTSLCIGMHYVASAVLAAKRSRTIDEEFLRPIANGRHITTLALSEPGTGAHFYWPQARLTAKDDSSWKLDGRKAFVTNAGAADSYVVSVQEGGGTESIGRFSCVVVPAASRGIEVGDPWTGFGMRGNNSRALLLESVEIPHDYLLGSEGDQIWYVFHVVAPYFLAAMAGTYLGIAEAALVTARDHLKEREFDHSGRRLSDEPVLQHRLGTLWARLQATRRLAYWAAHEFDSGGENALPAILSSKAEVAECAVTLVNEAMTLCGGRAYAADSTLLRLLRDARAAHIMAPTTDILRTWVGRALLGQPLLAE